MRRFFHQCWKLSRSFCSAFFAHPETFETSRDVHASAKIPECDGKCYYFIACHSCIPSSSPVISLSADQGHLRRVHVPEVGVDVIIDLRIAALAWVGREYFQPGRYFSARPTPEDGDQDRTTHTYLISSPSMSFFYTYIPSITLPVECRACKN